jgi:CHASE2 domain-containing sensor protein
MYVFNFAWNSTFTQIFSFQDQASNDFSFNDLHYHVIKNKLYNYHDEDLEPFTDEKNVVIINTGDIPTYPINQFRDSIINLIHKIELFKPKVIGIDINFNQKNTYKLNELKKIIDEKKNIIIADTSFKSNFFNKHYSALNAIPSSSSLTVRDYFNNENYFAFKVAQKFDDKKVSRIGDETTFKIKYLCLHDGIVHFSDNTNLISSTNFLYINSSELLLNFEQKSILNDKIVLIGKLGDIDNKLMTIEEQHEKLKFDIEDKFKVPCDTNNLIFRDKIMSGVVIHANAIENILDPKKTFYEIDSTLIKIISEITLFFYLFLLINYPLGKLLNIVLLFVVSIPIILITVYIMEFNFYISLGVTLLYLLLYEELVEIIEPVYLYLKKFINRKKEKNECN